MEGKLIETENIENTMWNISRRFIITTAIIPLTEQLNQLNTGYEHAIKTRVSHLLYMDDFKLIGKTE
jgi:oligoribonuclease (3'-5' exoribonuclease)